MCMHERASLQGLGVVLELGCSLMEVPTAPRLCCGVLRDGCCTVCFVVSRGAVRPAAGQAIHIFIILSYPGLPRVSELAIGGARGAYDDAVRLQRNLLDNNNHLAA